ncbi:MAG: peptidoglycan bridge formation glycyltransferase FemA/FemB family protein [Patescibacteria group bacterium]|nr:peptidoglycan bridge formation glycyltransferase FemA/FemB family protein [Patescibacteria group bacterium]
MISQVQSHPLQSEFWAKVRNQLGVATKRVNGLLLSIHPLPLIDYRVGYLPRSKLPSADALRKIYQFGRESKLIFVKLEPYEEKSVVDSDRWLEELRSRYHLEIVRSRHSLFPQWTQILDLRKTEVELLKNMHPKTRYNIRLAQRKGVIVKEMSNETGFKIFTDLYFQTSRRQGYFGHNKVYHQVVWANLKGKITHILVAFFNDYPLAAFQIWIYENVAYYVYGGSSKEHRNLMGSNLLMWEAVRFAKAKGAKMFDLWGSLPPDYHPDHPWAGFTRFKSGYGTTFIELVGSFDLIIRKNLYRFFSLSFQFRNLILKKIGHQLSFS